MGWKLIRRALLVECIQQFPPKRISMLRLKVSLSCAQIDETFPFSEAVLPLNDVCEPVIYNTPSRSPRKFRYITHLSQKYCLFFYFKRKHINLQRVSVLKPYIKPNVKSASDFQYAIYLVLLLPTANTVYGNPFTLHAFENMKATYFTSVNHFSSLHYCNG